MKKLTALILLLCLILGLASCAVVAENGSDSKSAAERSAAETSYAVVEESSEAEASSAVEESSETPDDSTDESEASKNEHPDTVIYNTTEKESYGARFKFEGNYAFSEQFGDNCQTDEPRIKALIEQNKGNDDVCFLVALFPIPRDCDWDVATKNVPESGERLAVIKNAEKYLNGIGFASDPDHIWNYTAYESGENEYLHLFALVGYMTADMITSINDPDNKYVILHLPSESDWEKFWSPSWRHGISLGNVNC